MTRIVGSLPTKIGHTENPNREKKQQRDSQKAAACRSKQGPEHVIKVPAIDRQSTPFDQADYARHGNRARQQRQRADDAAWRP
ncbi:MAG: hypothetical protein ABI162_00845 [Luteolibacter sp.]